MCEKDGSNFLTSELNIFDFDNSAGTQVKTAVERLMNMALDLGKIEGDTKFTARASPSNSSTKSHNIVKNKLKLNILAKSLKNQKRALIPRKCQLKTKRSSSTTTSTGAKKTAATNLKAS